MRKQGKYADLLSIKQKNLFFVAIKMLLNSKKRFIGMVIGATFSAFIIMQQPSVYQGVTDRLVAPIRAIPQTDLWVMSKRSFAFDQPTQFKATDVYRIRSIPGVQSALQLYRTWYPLKHVKTKKKQNWELIGVDPKTLTGLPAQMLEGDRTAIYHANSLIIDGYSLKQLTAEGKKSIQLGDKLTEHENTWTVSAITNPLRTYMTEPKAYIVSNHLPDIVHTPSFILVQAKSDADIEIVARDIEKKTGFLALTPEQFVARSNQFFREQTPIVMGFISIATIGFSIGLIMMWQIFSNFVISHLHQFGMLKMLGTSNASLMHMVLCQAAITGGLGYLAGLCLTGLFGLIFYDTIIAFHLTWQIILLGLVGTTFVVLFASYFGILKVIRMDSVELCRDAN